MLSPTLAHVDVFFPFPPSCPTSLGHKTIGLAGLLVWMRSEPVPPTAPDLCQRHVFFFFLFSTIFSHSHIEPTPWRSSQMNKETRADLDDRSSVTRTEARRFLVWWGKGMRATAVERSKAPWPQWPALDRHGPRCPCREGKQRAAAIRPPPSSCPFRGGSMFAGEDERDSRSSPAPPHKKKRTAVPLLPWVQAFFSQSWPLFLACPGACPVSCWASTVLCLPDLHTTSLHTPRASRCFGSMQSRQPTKPSTSLSCLPVPHLGIHLAISSITRLGFPSGPGEVETPTSSPPLGEYSPPSSVTSECPQQVTASVHD